MKDNLIIDVVILSYAQNPTLQEITNNCINSLLTSEKEAYFRFNVIVVESERRLQPFQYNGTTTVYPDQEFGYHKYMNVGIAFGSAPLVCLCNNDLLFHEGWATELLKAFIDDPTLSSASPVCSIHHPGMGFPLNSGVYPGYRIRYEISGWCLFLKRDIFRITGKLDENLKFWCADNDYANTLAILGLKHALVSSSIVDHLETKTLDVQSLERQEELTEKATVYYGKKWSHRFGEGWVSLG